MYPFGLAPKADGTGTTPEGLQRALFALFSRPGIIDGCTITPSSTAMTVSVGAGAVAAVRASGMLVVVPVSPVTVTLPAAPASGSRVDLLLAEAATGNIVVGSSASSGKQVIGKITVPAGATNASQCTVSADRLFAMLRGGSQGILAQWADPTPRSQSVANTSERVLCQLRIPPQSTDRRVDVLVKQSAYLHASATPDLGTVEYEVYRGAQLMETFELGYTKIWEPRHNHTYFYLLAGRSDVIKVTARKTSNIADLPDPLHLGNWTDGRAASSVTVHDLGGAN